MGFVWLYEVGGSLFFIKVKLVFFFIVYVGLEKGQFSLQRVELGGRQNVRVLGFRKEVLNF